MLGYSKQVSALQRIKLFQMLHTPALTWASVVRVADVVEM